MNDVIAVAGMPRSGSMWTYNVVRALITAAGKTPLPPHTQIPLSSVENIELLKKALNTKTFGNEMYCIKLHYRINSTTPRLKIICNYRDVRESVLSFMRFMHCDFAQGIQTAGDMMSMVDFYHTHQNKDILLIRYDEIKSTPIKLLKRISNFLNVTVPQNTISTINTRFSLKQVKNMLNTLQEIPVAKNGSFSDTHRQQDFEVLSNVDGSFRILDKATGFQSNHITSKNDNEWRTFFTRRQKEILMEKTSDWLIKYNFSL